MALQDYFPWELKPRKLTREEMEDPLLVIHDFFSNSHLPQAREQLWELLKVAVTGNYGKSLTRIERSDLVFFYEQLEKLVEASHVIAVQNSKQIGEV
jgi:uncharacterized protein (UPF0216 family)